MTDVVPVPCTDPPKPPENVGGFALSDKSIFVSWDKPLGDGYKYTVSVDAEEKAKGVHGFGNAGFVQISGLAQGKAYTVKVKLECANNAGTFSEEKSAQVTTLATGK